MVATAAGATSARATARDERPKDQTQAKPAATEVAKATPPDRTLTPAKPKVTEKAKSADSGWETVLPKDALQGSSNEVWYIFGTIFGALFSYVLAPLVVEFLKLHVMGMRYEPCCHGYRKGAWAQDHSRSG
jgi:hypothetical protein